MITFARPNLLPPSKRRPRVSLARLAWKPDGRLAAGALGMAAAMLLPLAATLVVSGLQPQLDASQGWIVYRTDGGPLDLSRIAAPRAAVAEWVVDGQIWAAFVAGPARVEPGHARAWGPATLGGQALVVDGPPEDWPLLAPGRLLAHPADLPGAVAVAAIVDQAPSDAALTALPARGADAFEAATTEELRGATGFVILASLPAVGLVAMVFARLEVQERLHTSAVLASLGGMRQSRLLLATRILLVTAAGAALALAVAFALWARGGSLFHPVPFPRLGMVLAALVPAAAALVAGLAAVAGFSRRIDAALRKAPGPDLGRHLRLPLMARPLVLGTRLAPILLVCAALFAVDVGFPLAAGQVPATMVGGPGEWVVGAERGLEVGGGVSAAPAQVLGHDPAVEAIVAETLAPTILDGEPVVLRCGEWDALSGYHGLSLVAGQAPTGSSIVLAQRLATRHGWQVGDRLALQGAHRPFVVQADVAGIAQGSGIVADEAFCATGLGQALAGIPAGQATLVRLRPKSDEAKAALLREEGRIEVVGLSVFPERPVTGQVAEARIEGVNLGPRTASRVLAVRVNGEGIGHATLTIGPYGKAAAAVPFLVPEGEMRLQVNPEVALATAASDLALSAPALSFADRPLTVTLERDGQPVAGVAIGLYATPGRAANRSDPLATASTDGTGQAIFAAPGQDAVAATAEGPFAAARIHAGTDSDAANLTVEEAWILPADLRPGQSGRLFATVLNRGGAAGAEAIEVRRGQAILQFVHAELQSGESRTYEVAFALDKPADELLVGGSLLRLASQSGPAPPGPETPAATPIPRAGEAVQAELADRALGDARAVLLALAAVSLGTTLAVVVLGTRRALRSRTHVVGVLSALGQDETAVRSRAAWEAGVMAGLAMLTVLPLAKLTFNALAAPWGPTAFGHALPDPVGWMFALQAVAAFAALAALAAYNVAGRVVRPL